MADVTTMEIRPVTQAQNAANLKTASARVASRLGVDPANLTHAQRITYTRALAREILSFPWSFTEATLNTARIIDGRDDASLALVDDSFSWSEFVDAGAEEAEKLIPKVGASLWWGAVIIGAVAAFAAFKRKD